MTKENPNQQAEKEEKQLCQCGSPTEIKSIQVGWGSTPISVCTNPDCPTKTKKKKRGTGWCN